MPPSPSPDPVPSKASLKAWWKHWTLVQKMKAREPQHGGPGAVFGVPLRESLRTASVQISTADQDGELYVWGYIPVVVAKCGLFLKENGTEVEGVFRVGGSSKRMRELQTIFETPPRYGKNIEWQDHYFTPHDVAGVFRRFLTQMPEPIIPHALYHDFRNIYSKKPFVQDEVIASFKRLIATLSRANQYLLLYVLDLLTVFARKADKNRMTASNLAVIFRPAVLNHPSHEMSPDHHRLSQEVVEFLIEHQDWFMLDIPPPPRQDSILIANSKQGPQIPDDAYLGPTTSDDDKEKQGDGWRMIGSTSGQVRRRRTFSERGSARHDPSTNAASPSSSRRLTNNNHSDEKPTTVSTSLGASASAPSLAKDNRTGILVATHAIPIGARGGDLAPVDEHVLARQHDDTGGARMTAAQLGSKHKDAHNARTSFVDSEEKRGRNTIKGMFGVKRSRTLPTKRGEAREGERDHKTLKKRSSNITKTDMTTGSGGA